MCVLEGHFFYTCFIIFKINIFLGDIEDKAQWLKEMTKFYADELKTRAMNHPRIGN